MESRKIQGGQMGKIWEEGYSLRYRSDTHAGQLDISAERKKSRLQVPVCSLKSPTHISHNQRWKYDPPDARRYQAARKAGNLLRS